MRHLLSRVSEAVNIVTGKKPAAAPDRDPKGSKLHDRIIQAAQESGWNEHPEKEISDLQHILKHALEIMPQADRDRLEKKIGEKVYDDLLDDEWHIELREEHPKVTSFLEQIRNAA